MGSNAANQKNAFITSYNIGLSHRFCLLKSFCCKNRTGGREGRKKKWGRKKGRKEGGGGRRGKKQREEERGGEREIFGVWELHYFLSSVPKQGDNEGLGKEASAPPAPALTLC